MLFILHKILVPIVLLAVLIFVHELGHFLLAKWNGVGVVKFSIGFGPALFKFRRRETTYQLSLIPLGGFVRMVGDMPDMITGAQPTDAQVRADSAAASGEPPVEEQPKKDAPATIEELMPEVIGNPELAAMLTDKNYWFVEKGFWARSSIVVAGPLFNLIFAILTVWGMLLVYQKPIGDTRPIIGHVMAGSPAETAGLKDNDLVLQLNSEPVPAWNQLAERIWDGTGAPIVLQVKRGEEVIPITVSPMMQEALDKDGAKRKAFKIGIEQTTLRQPVSILEGFETACGWAYRIAIEQYKGLYGMVTLKVSPKDLGGPLFILDTAGRQAQKGWEPVLNFAALLSVCLAVLNLLPIPILDGGHLLFFIIEAIIGPISIRKKEFAQQLGMVLLLGLMVFAIKNDITRDPESASGEVKWTDQKKPNPETPEK